MAQPESNIREHDAPSPSPDFSRAPDLPELGHRNYWYPIIEAHRVKKRPVSVSLLGEEIVLFPDKSGKAVALVDRCPHRGTKLSRGGILFPGTLSCGYHGWTYNERGECVAAIVEGPESRVPGRVCVKAYPTEERFGIVWAFMGEGEAPPLEEDLPPGFLEPEILVQFVFEYWPCDWRNVTENYPDMLHAIFVHRNSPEAILQQIPAWGNLIVKPLPDGKGLFVQGPGRAMQAEYPGLGKYPSALWYRILRRRTSGGVGAEVRMPGYIILSKRREPMFGFTYSTFQWPIHVGPNLTRILELSITFPRNFLHRWFYKIWWRTYFKYIHRWFFTYQDKRLMEVQNYRAPETLCSTDVGVTLYRRLANKVARQANGKESETAKVSEREKEFQEAAS